MSAGFPTWLPPRLILPDPYFERLDFLREHFNELILNSPLTTEGETVHLNMRPFAEGMPEAFWHLVGKGDHRQIDEERASRMPWFRPLLEQAQDSAVYRWESEGTRKNQICRYLWLHEHDYFVVLAPGRQGGMFLVTAHHVEGRRRRRDLLRRYERAKASKNN